MSDCQASVGVYADNQPRLPYWAMLGQERRLWHRFPNSSGRTGVDPMTRTKPRSLGLLSRMPPQAAMHRRTLAD